MNRLVNNASWIIGCKIVQNILSFVVSMMSARYLGPSNYGLITYATSVVAFKLTFYHSYQLTFLELLDFSRDNDDIIFL